MSDSRLDRAARQAVKASLEGLHGLLTSDTATYRKDGFKQLQQLLESDHALTLLDKRTAALSRGAINADYVDHWPGLMSMVITAAHKELERLSRKRPAENSSVPFVHALRDVMHTAHAARKTDCPLPLWHCATPLYKVLCASMRSLGLLSVSGLECCTLLRHHVATPEYCDVGHHSVLQGFVTLCLDESPTLFGGLHSRRGQQVHNVLTTLEVVMRTMPADLSPDLQRDVLGFVSEFFTLFPQPSRDSQRPFYSFLSLSLVLLQRYGQDIAPLLAPLHTKVYPWVHSGLRDTKDGAHRQLMVTYLRYMLQLSVIEDLEQVHELRVVLEESIDTSSQKSILYKSSAQHFLLLGSITPLEYSAIDLVARLLLTTLVAQHTSAQHTSAQHGAPPTTTSAAAAAQRGGGEREVTGQGGDGEHSEGRASKRRRVQTPSIDMLHLITSAPRRWSPVLLQLIQRHTCCIPVTCLHQWLTAMLTCSQVYAEQLHNAGYAASTDGDVEAAAWAVKCTAALVHACCWMPAAQGGGGWGHGAQGGGHSQQYAVSISTACLKLVNTMLTIPGEHTLTPIMRDAAVDLAAAVVACPAVTGTQKAKLLSAHVPPLLHRICSTPMHGVDAPAIRLIHALYCTATSIDLPAVLTDHNPRAMLLHWLFPTPPPSPTSTATPSPHHQQQQHNPEHHVLAQQANPLQWKRILNILLALVQLGGGQGGPGDTTLPDRAPKPPPSLSAQLPSLCSNLDHVVSYSTQVHRNAADTYNNTALYTSLPPDWTTDMWCGAQSIDIDMEQHLHATMSGTRLLQLVRWGAAQHHAMRVQPGGGCMGRACGDMVLVEEACRMLQSVVGVLGGAAAAGGGGSMQGGDNGGDAVMGDGYGGEYASAGRFCMLAGATAALAHIGASLLTVTGDVLSGDGQGGVLLSQEHLAVHITIGMSACCTAAIAQLRSNEGFGVDAHAAMHFLLRAVHVWQRRGGAPCDTMPLETMVQQTHTVYQHATAVVSDAAKGARWAEEFEDEGALPTPAPLHGGAHGAHGSPGVGKDGWGTPMGGAGLGREQQEGMLVDEDLDMPMVNQQATQAAARSMATMQASSFTTIGSASLINATLVRRQQALDLLSTTIPLLPDTTGHVLLDIWKQSRPHGTPGGEGLRRRVVCLLVESVVCGAPRLLSPVLEVLGPLDTRRESYALLLCTRCIDRSMECVALQLARLFAAPVLEERDKVELVACLNDILAVVNDANQDNKVDMLSPRVGAALATAAAAAMQHYDQLSDEDTQVIMEQLGSSSYATRRAVADLAVFYFDLWDDAEAILDSILQHVLLRSVKTPRHLRLLEHQVLPYMESSILALARCAIHNADVEPTIICLLLRHALPTTAQRALISTALTTIAMVLGYTNTELDADCNAAFMQWHGGCIAWEWFGAKHTLQELLSIQSLLGCTTPSTNNTPPANNTTPNNNDNTVLQQRRFLKSWTKVLLPVMLCYDGERGMVHDMATLLGITVHDLVQNIMYCILGCLEPLTVVQDTGRMSSKRGMRLAHAGVLAEGVLREYDTPDAHPYLNNVLATAVLHCVDIEACPGQLCPPGFALESIGEVVERLTRGGASRDQPHEAFSDRFYALLLLKCHQHLHKAAAPRHAHVVLRGPLTAVMRLLGPRVGEPFAFHYMCHILLGLLDIRELQAAVCTLLHTIIIDIMLHGVHNNTPMQTTQEQAQERMACLAQHLRVIVMRLVEHVEYMDGSDGGGCGSVQAVGGGVQSGDRGVQSSNVQHAMAAIVTELIRKAPPKHPDLRLAVQLLPMLPPHVSCLENARVAHGQLRQPLTPLEELVLLARDAAAINANSRARAVDHVQHTLRTMQPRIQLSSTALYDGHLPALKHMRINSIAATCARVLLQASASLGDDKVAALAGEVLALGGPLGPHHLALPATMFHDQLTHIDIMSSMPPTPPPPTNAAAPNRGSVRRPATPPLDNTQPQPPAPLNLGGDAVYVSLLRLLCVYLTDGDVAVISTTHSTLKMLLANDARNPDKPAHLLNHLPPTTAALLRPFVGSSNTYKRPKQDPNTQASWDLRQTHVWVCADDIAYDWWVRGLAAMMLWYVRDPLLGACRGIASMKTEVAELVLPLAFVDIAHQSTSGRPTIHSTPIHDILTTQLTTHIIQDTTHHHPRADRMVLRCLHVLEQVHQAAVLEADALGVLQEAREAREGGRDVHLRDGTMHAAMWSTVYWLHLDYLSVSRMALRCAAPFTALKYLEEGVRAHHAQGMLIMPNENTTMGDTTTLHDALYNTNTPISTTTTTPPTTNDTPTHPDNMHTLFMEVYNQLDESDGLHAATRAASYRCRLLRALHQGRWADVLVTTDSRVGVGGWGEGGAAVQTQGVGSGQGNAVGGCGNERGMVGRALYHDVQAYDALQLRQMCLRRMGCHALAAASWEGAEGSERGMTDSGLHEAAAEAAWRMGQWGALDVHRGGFDVHTSGAGGFHTSFVAAVRAFAQGDGELVNAALTNAQAHVAKQLGSMLPEGHASFNHAVVQLQLATTVGEAWTAMQTHMPPTPSPHNTSNTSPSTDAWVHDVLSTLDQREDAAGAGGRFWLQEPLLALRLVLLRLLHQHNNIPAALVHKASHARTAGELSTALEAMMGLRREMRGELMTGGRMVDAVNVGVGVHASGGGGGGGAGVVMQPAWVLEDARLLWAQGQHDMAIQLTESLVQHAEDQRAIILTQLGAWLVASRSYSSPRLLETLTAAVYAYSTLTGPGACHAAYQLAQYCDTLYTSVVSALNSEEYKQEKAVMATKRDALARIDAAIAKRRATGKMRRDPQGRLLDREDYDLLQRQVQLDRPLKLDEARDEELHENKAQYLKLTLDSYKQCLQADTTYDTEAVFRCVALWLASADEGVAIEQHNNEVHNTLKGVFEATASHKWLPLVYQMASRLSTATTMFQQVLHAQLHRMAIDHPLHVLPCLFALANGDRDETGRQIPTNSHSSRVQIDWDKVTAAKQLLQAIGTNPTRQVLVNEMRAVVDAYIRLAAHGPPRDARSMPTPSDMRRVLLNYNTQCPLMSVDVPVDRTGGYVDVPRMARVETSIRIMLGVNKPKLVTCVDDHGRQHQQLVKSGRDDLRQDAVMQQFFGLVNNLVNKDSETARRQLQIRQYKVVPFSPCAGLLQWVDHTQPMVDYLTGSNRESGAMARYMRPGDWSYRKCYNTWASAVENKPSHEQRRAIYDEACAHTRPALHHFFLETWRDAGSWFEARLCYTRATAINSMAGYLIGLGDRHCANILLDVCTGQVVHIDLGIAFEQGRFLSTPERVPFRLTRNIIDGMGATGVEGAMTRCSVEVMRVLRANKASLLTIVEVLLHDPLYHWALTSGQADRRQQGGGGMGAAATTTAAVATEGGTRATVPIGAAEIADRRVTNVGAERALMRIKQKLDGTEHSDGEARGVEGQVGQLLAEACDPGLLCMMYVGWAPWL